MAVVVKALIYQEERWEIRSLKGLVCDILLTQYIMIRKYLMKIDHSNSHRLTTTSLPSVS